MKRKTAGQRILASAGRLSDSLLTDEELCFDRIDSRFYTSVAREQAAWGNALARVDWDVRRLSEHRLIEDMTDRHRVAINYCGAEIRNLGQKATRKALTAIGKELDLCEKTMAIRYKGTAAAAVKRVREVADDTLHRYQSDLYVRDAAASMEAFTAAVRLQVASEPDGHRLMKRLFSPNPAGLRGFGGRGVWWQTPSTLKATARAVSINSANWVRVKAMDEFNQVGAER